MPQLYEDLLMSMLNIVGNIKKQTHPTFDVYMSSVDVHQQLNMERGFPESFGIVINPRHFILGPCVGFYNLTELGSSELRQCNLTGVHRHEEISSFYKSATHVVLDSTQPMVSPINCINSVQHTTTVNQHVNWKHIPAPVAPPLLTSVPAKVLIPISPPVSTSPAPTAPVFTAAPVLVAPVFAARVPATADSVPTVSVPAAPVSTSDSVRSSDELQFQLHAKQRTDIGGSRVDFEHQYAQRAKESGSTLRASSTTLDLITHCDSYIRKEIQCSINLFNTGKSLRDHVLNIENGLMEAVASDLTTEMCYISTFLIDGRYLYTRWMDNGNLRGFVSSQQESIKYDKTTPVMWQVMTSTDLDKRSEQYHTSLQNKRETLAAGNKKQFASTGKRWEKVVGGDKRENKKSINASHRNIISYNEPDSEDIRVLGTFVYIGRKTHTLPLLPEANQGYQVKSGIYAADIDLTAKIDHHKVHVGVASSLSFSDHLASYKGDELTNQEQQTVINSLSNDSSSNGRAGVRFSEYFSTGDHAKSSIDKVILQFKPTSVRNRILYHWRLSNYDKVMEVLQGQLPSSATKRKTAPSSSNRQTSAKTKRVADTITEPVLDDMHVPEFQDTTTAIKTTAYMLFLQNLVSDHGVLEWRIHSDGVDTFAMNDINMTNGVFMQNAFVHVTRTSSNNYITYDCSCKMQSIVERENCTDGTTNCCIHIRFCKENIEKCYNSMINFTSTAQQAPSRIYAKIINSINQRNNAVVKLDQHERFHRFSVVSSDMKSCAVVKLETTRFSCRNGRCRAGKGHHRKIQTIGDPNNCEHLRVLHANRELWQGLVDKSVLNSLEEDDADETDEDNETEEPTDVPTETDPQSASKHFDPISGLWKFPSVSTHVPWNEDDPVLQYSARYRRKINAMNTGTCLQNGYFMQETESGPKPFALCPELDKNKLCHCGEKYWSKKYPDGITSKRYSNLTNVYLQHGIAKFEILDRECLQKKEHCRIIYSGRQDAIHLLSSQTAAGDELGWDFVNTVCNSQTSITAYCLLKSNKYIEKTVKFMSRQTFTDYIFSWMANFKTDFREACNTCNFNPSILACDGTKLGMYFRNTFISPIETPTSDDVIKPSHKRTMRQFFCYSDADSDVIKRQKRLAQEDLSYFIAKRNVELEKWTKEHSKQKGFVDRSEEVRRCDLLDQTPIECRSLVEMFVDNSIDDEMIKVLCPLFILLVSRSPLTSLFPYSLLSTITNILNGTASQQQIRNKAPELYKILDLAEIYGVGTPVKECFLYIINAIVSTHSNDRDPGDGSSILESYNPELTGRAYYFHSHGGRIRDLPNYVVTGTGSTTQTDQPMCRKFYQDATKSGTTYLFLWFDPIHGHCYGFHVITTSEGRKDPFASIYMYKKDSPDAVYYDFSCQLEEYCLNREPSFWRECRFFHDIFHGYSHKCPYVYNARRIPDIDKGVNSEICEQFNSYIQKIKTSSRSMNQSHFMFYVQFFIHRWNQLKSKTTLKEKAIAEALLQ